jgi:chromosomal replication initiator protein
LNQPIKTEVVMAMNEEAADQLRALAAERHAMAVPKALVVQAIVNATALAFGASPEAVTGRSRSKSLAEARTVVCYVTRRCTRLSYPEIGRALDRDHTTIISAVQRVAERRIRDRWTDSVCSLLLEQFGEIEAEAQQ